MHVDEIGANGHLRVFAENRCANFEKFVMIGAVGDGKEAVCGGVQRNIVDESWCAVR